MVRNWFARIKFCYENWCGPSPQHFGLVHCGPVAAVMHGFTGVRLRQCCGSLGLAVRSLRARGRCEEPIPGVSGERVVLGRGGWWQRRLRDNDGEGSQDQVEGGEVGL
jgi:hypothetical protein